MKIRKLPKDTSVSSRAFERDSSSGPQKSGSSFDDQLQKVKGEMVHRELEKLFIDVEKQGRVLAETMNIKDMKKYRDLIQKFLDYAVNEMYQMNEQHGWDRRGRHKIYLMIETVNKEFENLTSMLLTDQKDGIAVLAKIDEIRGLLIDIYS